MCYDRNREIYFPAVSSALAGLLCSLRLVRLFIYIDIFNKLFSLLFVRLTACLTSASRLALSYDFKIAWDAPLPFFNLLLSGYPVCLYDIGEEQLAKARETVKNNLEKLEVCLFVRAKLAIFYYCQLSTSGSFIQSRFDNDNFVSFC